MTEGPDTSELTAESTSRTSRGPDVVRYHDAGAGAPLILLHGAGPGVTAWSNFGGNVAVLARQFRTLAVDQPGYGKSYRPELNQPYYTIADAVVRLMDELELERVDVLGNSMGAGVAARMALRYPDRVRRLILMGAAGLGVNVMQALPSEGLKRLREFAANPTRDRLIEWMKTMVAHESTITDELVDTRLANAIAPGQLDWMKAYMAAMGASAPPQNRDPVPMWAQASEIVARTLIICGRDDRMIPLELNLLPARQMPNVELHVFSGCGHWAMIERKDDFERLVVEFLTRS